MFWLENDNTEVWEEGGPPGWLGKRMGRGLSSGPWDCVSPLRLRPQIPSRVLETSLPDSVRSGVVWGRDPGTGFLLDLG